MTKMAAVPVYGKKPLKLFSENTRPMTFELGIHHLGCRPYKVCSDGDPRLRIIYFTTRSALLLNVFVWKMLKSTRFYGHY